MIRMSPITAAVASSVVFAGLFAGSALATVPPPPPGPAPAMPDGPAAQNPAVEQFRATLQRFGTFQQHPRYGEVWTPAPGLVPPGWSPYPECHWTYDRAQNAWYFNDQTEWGSIVHHYGRWANDPQLGWMWVADANFGPGWVAWRAEAHQVSWAPLPPEQDGATEPQQGWRSQDTASFNAGCRRPAPPPPMAAAPAPPPPAVMAPMGVAPVRAVPVYAPPPRIVGGPVFIPGGRPPIVIVDRCVRFPFAPGCRWPRPGGPFFGGGLPPQCATGIRPSWCSQHCIRNPFGPGCRGPGGNNRTPGPLGAACALRPHMPVCRQLGGVGVGGPSGFCSRIPNHPRCRAQQAGGMGRPGQFRPRIGQGVPRPHQFRPFGGGFQRPHFGGVHRPQFGPRFGGGAPRFAGGGVHRGPMMGGGGFGGRRFR